MLGISIGTVVGRAAVGAALLSAASGAGAGPIANQIQNGGFEQYESIGGNVIPNWSVSGPTVGSGITDFPAWEGLAAYSAASNGLTLSQVVSVIPGEGYTFSIRNNFIPQTAEAISTTLSVWLDSTEYTITVDTDAFNGPGDVSVVDGTFWSTDTLLPYTATSSTINLQIIANITPAPTDTWFINIDDVQLVGPTPGVPEIDATAYAAALVIVAGGMALRSHRA